MVPNESCRLSAVERELRDEFDFVKVTENRHFDFVKVTKLEVLDRGFRLLRPGWCWRTRS